MRCLALTLAAAVLLAACSGDDGESSTTPTSSLATTATSSPTEGGTQSATSTEAPTPLESPTVVATAQPDLRLCAADDLSVAFVRSGVAAGTSYPTYGINNNGGSPCALPGPPALRFEDAGGVDLAIPYRENLPCSSSTAEQFCLLDGSVALQATDVTPAPDGPVPSAAVVVAISGTGNYRPCAPPNVFASSLVFVFPEVGEMGVPLDEWELQQCETQVTVYSFR